MITPHSWNIASKRGLRFQCGSFTIGNLRSEDREQVPTTRPLTQTATSRRPASTSSYAVTFSPELDLILTCCGEACSSDAPRGEFSTRVQHILQSTGLNWNHLLQLAQQHGVLPLVYRRLSTAISASHPAQLVALRQEDSLNAHRALWLAVELLNIHRHLATRGLEVLPYKGPILAETLYGNVALRQFSDLDFLVRPRDVLAVRSALAELGYTPALRLTQAAERAYLKSGYEYTFDNSQGKNLVEVKWQILPRFYSVAFEVDDLFHAAVEVDLSGHKLHTLCDQDLMLVLCVHAAKHGWRQISWLCDITQLARSRTLDWAALRNRAAKLGIARIVAVSFLLAHKLLATSLPAQLEVESDPLVEPLAQKIMQQIVGNEEFDSESLAYFRLMMDLRERRGDRASFAWRLWVTPSTGEWSSVRLPGVLFPLYRAVRMCRLAGRMLSSAASSSKH